MDKLRNTLFESEENQQIVETKKIDEVEETKIIVKREEKVQENKNKEKKENVQLFAPDKIEDEKRILDFFTGFFSPGDMSENITLDELNKKQENKEVDELSEEVVDSSIIDEEKTKEN